MSILEDLTVLLPVLDVPMETGVFSNMAPDQYLVIVPLSDSFDLYADNEPVVDIQEARLSLYSKGSYTAVKNRLVRLLVKSGYTITDRQYLGFEPESGYHHFYQGRLLPFIVPPFHIRSIGPHPRCSGGSRIQARSLSTAGR